ncbi:MAG: hypothetical protein AB7O26_19025 [Planctomycetaceae bacterium]
MGKLLLNATAMWLLLTAVMSTFFYWRTTRSVAPDKFGRYDVEIFAGGFESWSTGEIMLSSIFQSACVSAIGFALTLIVMLLVRSRRAAG